MADSVLLSDPVSIEWVQGPIQLIPGSSIEGAGAVVTFRGVVRPYEDGRLLKGLEYTRYDPMARQQLYRLARRAVDQHGLHHVQIIHSLGFVSVNDASLLVNAASKHRKAALAAMEEILNDLKRDVPIWKSPIFADEHEAGA